MIHREGAIQTPKGSGRYLDGELIPLGTVLKKRTSRLWWKKRCKRFTCRQRLGVPEILRAIACIHPPLGLEGWGESVSSFLANGNHRIVAPGAIALAAPALCAIAPGADRLRLFLKAVYGDSSRRKVRSLSFALFHVQCSLQFVMAG
jgi:hypothetical protein